MKEQSIKDLYLAFSLKNHAEGSHAPGSYVTAIDIIDIACHQHNFFLEQNESVWDICDANRLTKLYGIIKKEIKKDDGGIFRDIKTKSYWQNNYCSAAIGEFTKFLILTERESVMLQKFETINDAQELTQELDNVGIVRNTLLISDNKNTIDVNSREGREKLAKKQIDSWHNEYHSWIFALTVLKQRGYRFQCHSSYDLNVEPWIEVEEEQHSSFISYQGAGIYIAAESLDGLNAKNFTWAELLNRYPEKQCE